MHLGRTARDDRNAFDLETFDHELAIGAAGREGAVITCGQHQLNGNRRAATAADFELHAAHVDTADGVGNDEGKRDRAHRLGSRPRFKINQEGNGEERNVAGIAATWEW
jgi:hypothetical protein